MNHTGLFNWIVMRRGTILRMNILVSMVALILLATPSKAYIDKIHVVPDTVDQQELSFAITAEKIDSGYRCKVSVESKKQKISQFYQAGVQPAPDKRKIVLNEMRKNDSIQYEFVLGTKQLDSTFYFANFPPTIDKLPPTSGTLWQIGLGYFITNRANLPHAK